MAYFEICGESEAWHQSSPLPGILRGNRATRGRTGYSGSTVKSGFRGDEEYRDAF